MTQLLKEKDNQIKSVVLIRIDVHVKKLRRLQSDMRQTSIRELRHQLDVYHREVRLECCYDDGT